MGRTWPVGVLVALLAAACSQPPPRPRDDSAGPATPPPSASPRPTQDGAAPEPARPTRSTRSTETFSPRVREPLRSYLTVPALGLRAFPVVRYRGTPDDGPGTRIQNGGPTASPRGPGGGVGPGAVGNFIITGHRTSGAAPFADLPLLVPGDRVQVRSGRTEFVYELTGTRSTSFRSPASMARQTAPVPGRPGEQPTRAMITLSTCATPEDHAAGNFWSDRFHNPEHRIDKIGVLVATRSVRR